MVTPKKGSVMFGKTVLWLGRNLQRRTQWGASMPMLLEAGGITASILGWEDLASTGKGIHLAVPTHTGIRRMYTLFLK